MNASLHERRKGFLRLAQDDSCLFPFLFFYTFFGWEGGLVGDTAG